MREDRGDDAADELLEGVPASEAECDEVVGVDSAREGGGVTWCCGRVFEGGEETAVDWAGRVEGGEDLFLEEKSFVCMRNVLVLEDYDGWKVLFRGGYETYSSSSMSL